MDNTLILQICEYAAAIGAGIAAIHQWVIKPLKAVYEKQTGKLEQMVKTSTEEDEKIREDIGRLEKTIEITQADVADVLGDRLVEAHSKYMTLGWCPAEAKTHFIELHRRYIERAHNHVPAKYEEDLMNLPEVPPQKIQA